MKPISRKSYVIRLVICFLSIPALSITIALIERILQSRQSAESQEISNYPIQGNPILHVIWVIGMIIIGIFMVYSILRFIVTIKSENKPGSLLSDK